MQFDIVLEQYLNKLERKRVQPATVVSASTVFKSFQNFLNARNLKAVDATDEDLEDYFAEILDRLSITTVYLHRIELRAAYRYALKRNLIQADPTEDIQLPKIPDPEPHIFSNQELANMLEASGPLAEKLLIYGLAFTGLRRTELINVKFEDVNFKTQMIRVVGKGSKLRHVPIHPAYGEWLSEAFKEKREAQVYVMETARKNKMSQGWFEDRLKTIMARAEVTEGSAHSFRRTFASSLYKNGVRSEEIDQICGWAKTTIRQKYYVTLDTDALHDAVLKVYMDKPVDRQRHLVAV